MYRIDPRIRHIVDAVALRYDTTPYVVMGVISTHLSWNSARALAVAVRETYPDWSLAELSLALRRIPRTVEELLEDGSPDRVPKPIKRGFRWCETRTARLKQLVVEGCRAEQICHDLGLDYPRQRSLIYNEVKRLVNNGLLRPGNLGSPRPEVDSAGD